MSSSTQQSPAPSPAPSPAIPWQIIDLIATTLDPKTLATAACVSKQWSSAMTSDQLWHHLCTTHFPSLLHLRSTAVPPLPYHRLYNLGSTASKRRQRQPSKPLIALQDLLFILTLNNSTSPPVTVVRPGSKVSSEHDSLFRFDFDVRERDKWRKFEVSDETKVTWNVVLRGYEGVFTMMDCKGKGSFVSGSDGWFSAELPAAGWCCASSGGGGSGMVAEMRLVMREEGGETVVGRVNVGVLSVVSWRYVGVDDGLRYLQHFLEPEF